MGKSGLCHKKKRVCILTHPPEIKEFIKFTANSPVEWDGIRLHPIAERLFMLATDFSADMITAEQIKINLNIS